MKTIWITLGVLAGLLIGAHLYASFRPMGLCYKCLLFQSHSHGWGNEWSAATNLKTLATAQADFRTNDRDGDSIHQFWRKDVAGLYALVPKGGTAIKLIELSVAAADDRPVADLSPFTLRGPKGGYWFRAIRHADEDPKALNPNSFAFCAFPDTPASGKYIFIIDEDNRVYRTEAKGRRGVEVFPTEEELNAQWSKID